MASNSDCGEVPNNKRHAPEPMWDWKVRQRPGNDLASPDGLWAASISTEPHPDAIESIHWARAGQRTRDANRHERGPRVGGHHRVEPGEQRNPVKET